ncbi:hypothetical protein FVE85_7760 [Porphyridium purpureum]|uniref:Uncharacterized protein n=1 Tax=Porphyridium purpureum TaxID=35688 RepID=A0A5J4YIX4_PORPP|nr:hypothetical protein FVE85_7760 [Porphyridium purpureum]|eukprot:POR9375..scf210_14
MCSEGGSDSDAGLKRALYGTWNRDLVGSFLPRVRAYSMPAVRGFFRLTESDEKLISYEDRDVARQMWRVRFRDILDKISGYDIARLQAPNRSTEGYPQYHGRKLNEKPFGDNSVINMSDIEYKRLVYAYEFWELARECAGLSVTLFEHTLYAEKGPLRAPEMDERMWLAWCQLQHQWTACKLFKRDTDAIVLPNGQRKYRWDDPPAFEFDAYAAHTCLQKYGGVDHVVKCKFVNQRRVPWNASKLLCQAPRKRNDAYALNTDIRVMRTVNEAYQSYDKMN